MANCLCLQHFGKVPETQVVPVVPIIGIFYFRMEEPTIGLLVREGRESYFFRHMDGKAAKLLLMLVRPVTVGVVEEVIEAELVAQGCCQS